MSAKYGVRSNESSAARRPSNFMHLNTPFTLERFTQFKTVMAIKMPFAERGQNVSGGAGVSMPFPWKGIRATRRLRQDSEVE